MSDILKIMGSKQITYVLLILALLGIYILFGVIGVYKTEDGIVLGLPYYERRSIRVSQVDLDILRKADAVLLFESSWRKESVSDCALSEKQDLFCALEKASVDVMGRYVHRQPALQEVRFVIDDNYRERWTKHRIIDFNVNENTNYQDIKYVLAQAKASVSRKLTLYRAK